MNIGKASKLSDSTVTATRFYANIDLVKPCLLSTSDAADDLNSVDLGSRRIITQKINIEQCTIPTKKQQKPYIHH